MINRNIEKIKKYLQFRSHITLQWQSFDNDGMNVFGVWLVVNSSMRCYPDKFVDRMKVHGVQCERHFIARWRRFFCWDLIWMGGIAKLTTNESTYATYAIIYVKYVKRLKDKILFINSKKIKIRCIYPELRLVVWIQKKSKIRIDFVQSHGNWPFLLNLVANDVVSWIFRSFFQVFFPSSLFVLKREIEMKRNGSNSSWCLQNLTTIYLNNRKSFWNFCFIFITNNFFQFKIRKCMYFVCV